MARNWTDEQLSAIESNKQNLLLSAAAGSGKTAVLVERIISRLKNSVNPIDADKLLVVTFTNAAANEMRERIISALEALYQNSPGDKKLARQLTLIKKAQITTIDSFCIDILREYFTEAGLSPDFSVADPTECKVMLDESLDKVINEMYDDEIYGRDFLCLMESYANSKANDRGFRELLHSIYNFSTSLPYPDEWLDFSCKRFKLEGSFSESFYKDVVINEAHAECERASSEYATMIALADEDLLTNFSSLLMEEKFFFDECLKISDYDELREKLINCTFKRRPAVPKNCAPVHLDTIVSMRDRIKVRRIGKLCDRLLNLSSIQQEHAIKKMHSLMVCLAETVKRLSREFTDVKLSKNMLDFSDCEHNCLKVLKNPEIAKIVTEKYDEIYIDEYQDTSKLQEEIFSCIKKENNLFMVGDIKQSIYRFRNTDPLLFKTKQKTFSKDTESLDRKIILSKNFRSRKNILDSINFIFERIMSEEAGEIDYNADEKLYFGAVYPEDAQNPIDNVTEVAIIDSGAISDETDEDLGKIEFQAMYCARRISELIESGVEIFDGEKYRKITYKDICVISRNVKDNSVILNAVLSDYGIPCYAENTGSFFESREVELMLMMLSVIDNPYQDLPLLSVLRSVFFNISSEQLAQVRVCNKKASFYDAVIACSESDSDLSSLCQGIVDTISRFSEKSKRMSVSELILDIYNSTGFYDAQQTLPNGIMRCANLRLLYSRAKAYESKGLRGLFSFIKFITDFKETGSDLESAKLSAEQNDAVKIMSIHKSKGLEFPVVILFAAEHQFNMMDLHKNVLYHADYGFGPKFVDTDMRITYTFAPRSTLEGVLYRESIAEEMRILYVALTRAREKLIIIGADKDVASKIKKCTPSSDDIRLSPSVVSEHISYLDWIIMALLDHEDASILRYYTEQDRNNFKIESSGRFFVKIIDNINELTGTTLASPDNDVKGFDATEDIVSLVNFKYPYLDNTKLPSKITVSEVKKRREESVTEGYEIFKKRKKISEKSQGLSPAEIGIAYHTVLQKCDLSASFETKEDIKNQIDEIKSRGFLTEEEAGAVNPDKILKFFKSGTGRMLLSSPIVKREYMFCVSIPAKNFISTTESDEEIMLQGIIDCLLITDDGIVVIDYKTDRSFDAADTIEKYRIQLDCYKYAAEVIFKKPVIRKILYMFEGDIGMNL